MIRGRRIDFLRAGIAAGVLVWVAFVAAAATAVGRWHARDREALEAQARAVLLTLSNTLRPLSRAAPRSEAQMRAVFREVTGTPTVSGLAVLDALGEVLVVVDMEANELEAARGTPGGTLYGDDHLLLWQTVDIGACPWHCPLGPGPGGGEGGPVVGGPGRRRGRGRHAEGDGAPGAPVRVAVQVPLSSVQLRHRQDVMVLVLGAAGGGALIAALLGLGFLARRSAVYSARLEVAAEEKRALQELNLVAAGLAHEVKNPLGVVRGCAQRISEHESVPRPQRQSAGSIVEEIDRVTSRLNEFLSFARPGEPRVAPFRAAPVLDHLRVLLEEEFVEAGVALVIADCDRCIVADPEQFRQLVFNLLHNAARFAPDSGPVTCRLEADGRCRCRFIVRDRGPGVSPEVRDRLFDPYVTTSQDGTGLGLAIVVRIAKAHGWTVQCRDAEDGGTVFIVDGIETRETTARA